LALAAKCGLCKSDKYKKRQKARLEGGFGLFTLA